MMLSLLPDNAYKDIKKISQISTEESNGLEESEELKEYIKNQYAAAAKFGEERYEEALAYLYVLLEEKEKGMDELLKITSNLKELCAKCDFYRMQCEDDQNLKDPQLKKDIQKVRNNEDLILKNKINQLLDSDIKIKDLRQKIISEESTSEAETKELLLNKANLRKKKD